MYGHKPFLIYYTSYDTIITMTKQEISGYMAEIGRKGGKARARKLSPKRLSEIGTLAVKAREHKRATKK